jgi:hypothetical protein
LPSPSQIHSRDDLGGDFSKAKGFKSKRPPRRTAFRINADYQHLVLGATTDTDIRSSWPSEVDNPSVPNPVIAPHSAEKSRVLASSDPGYISSFLM